MSTLTRTSPTTGIAGEPVDPRRRRPRGWLLSTLILVAVASSVAIFLPIPPIAVGVAAMVLQLAMVLLRIPIALTLIVPGAFGLYAIGGMRMLSSMLGSTPYHEVASWSLSVIPMFVFMGVLLSKTPLPARLYSTARQWLWWLPGGLAVGTNIAGAGLASVTGSTIGSTYALARIGIPEMIKAGYDRRLAVLAVMAASLPGQLIPPSILLIIYAGIAQAPVGPQLMAGVVPGILIAVVFCVILVGVAVVNATSVGGRGSQKQFKVGLPTMLTSLVHTWPVPVLMIIIIGGMFTGFFTATEAGAAAALVAALFGLGTFLKKRDLRPMGEAVIETLGSTGMIFLLIIGANFFSQLLMFTGLSTAFADWIETSGFDRITFLLIMVVVYLVLGLAMESLPMMLLTIPVLLPTLASLDISLLWFGVFVVLMAELGILTPPVGILAFIMHNIVQDPKVNLGVKISLKDIMFAVLWVMPGALLVVALLIVFPEIATWLPDIMSQAR